MNDKATRAALLTAAGILDKARARTAVTRAGGQIAPSKYLPDVPRQVHAAGGKVAFMQGNHPDVPPVMYHGTGAAKDFSSFSLPGNKTNRKTGGNAIYLSTSPETAGTFANYGESPRIIPAHVSAKNPFDFRNPDHIEALQNALTKNFKSWLPGAMYSPQTAVNWMRGGDFGLLENDNVRSWMKRRGHDSYFVTEGEGKPLNLAVFKPEQVKSAIGNQGTFDPNDPDMTRAEGGRVLPKGYSLKVDPDRLGVLARFKGRNVGQLTLSRDRETGKLSAFQMAVHPDHQRKGLMSAMHDAAEDAFGPMEPDKTLTDQGFAFWKGYRPDAVSNNLRFHTDKLMGQTVKTPYGPGTVRSVGSTGMNAELENGNTGWARAADNEDVLRNVGIDPSTLKYADGGRVEDAINALPHVGQNRNGVPPEEAVASPLPHMEYPYMSMTPAKSVYAEPLRMAINKAHAEAKVEDVPMDKIVTDVGAIGKSKIRNPAEGHPFIERINGVHHLRDGNHRAAAAFLRGDRSIKALVADMDEAIKVNGRADGGRIGKAYGGGFGYVPQNFTAPQQLTVAQVARPKQQQGTSPLEALAQLAELNTKKPEETAAAPQGSPSAASEGHPPAEGVSTAAQAALDALRNSWSGAPISVISDYRDPTKNQAVGGAKGSQHLHGNAFDIDTTGWTEEQKLALATNAYNAGFRGFGFYGNNLHFDVGGQRAWGPSYHQDSIPEWAQPWTQQYIYASGGRVGKAGGGALGDNFQSWFGNSVTHTDGQPHVFYTGTSKDKDFTSFNVGRHGAWFTRDPAVASSYAEENDSQGYKQDGWNMVKTNTASRVIPAYVKAENPYMGEYTGAMTDNYKKAQSDWFDTLRAKGHDAWMPASQGGNLVVALKEPQQIKSIYNNGQFDPNQKHMNKAGGGEIDGVGNNQIGEIGNAQAAPGNGQVGPQALGLLGSGGVRGGQGVLPAPSQASGEEDLIGLPNSVKMPKLGQTITAGHDPRIRQVSRDYARTSGIDYTPPTTYQKVDPARAKRIADAYEAMPHDPDHPLVKASYNALLNETKAQYDAMKRAGVNLEFYPDVNNDPYKSNPRLAVEDIRKNNHMYVYPTDAGYGTGDAMPDLGENPMLGDSGERWNGKPVMFNDLFRAVHDYFGHAKEGVGFRADGEENAWRQHAAMFSPLARIALATETRGQNSWLNYGPHGDKNRTAATEDTVFAPQKLGVLPIWAHHEGAEDFIKPQERAQVEAIYRQYSKPVNKALELTRRFTKDGAAATMALKSKGN